jgi:hypothetical protein
VPTYYQDLEAAAAVRGRRVRIGNTLLVSRPPSPREASAANTRLQVYLDNPTLGPGAARVRQPDDRVFLDTSMEGTLKKDWSQDLDGLRRSAFGQVQSSLVAAGVAADSADPGELSSIVDLDAASRTVTLDPSYYDPTGEISKSGTINWGKVVEHGAEAGLKAEGEVVGGALKGGTKGALEGVAGGLGVGGTIALVLVVLLVLGAWLFFAFHGAGV